DAFGLPAENAAIKRGIHPRDWTAGNIERMKQQFRRWGILYDWSKELASCEPEYYRWNQWLFLQLYKRGLAYRGKAPVNWCPADQTVLANEQVVDGRCDRCNSVVEQRELEQWFLKITDYADRLDAGLDTLVDWPEKVKLMQRNWIGRSVGADVEFFVPPLGGSIRIFTTANRLDTLPPELQRRFNLGIWFFDVPTDAERASIWKIQTKRFGLECRDLPDDTGWVGSDIRNCCQTAYMLNASLKEAAQWITLVGRTARAD